MIIDLMSNKKNEQNELSASEALFGFMGWLTTRPDVSIFSSSHNAAPAANLIKDFCRVNNLSEPEENWDRRLQRPPY